MANKSSAAILVLAAVLFSAVGSARGQAPPGEAPSAQPAASTPEELAALPLESPSLAEMAARPNWQSFPRNVREAQVAAQQRRALEATVATFQKLAAEQKQDLAVTLRNHKKITGRVLSADASEFKIRARYNRQEITVRYDEVAQWRVEPTAGTQALQTTALILLTIPLFPIFLLAGLAGWDGC
jgi:hypothetical protein